jgi:hypothetical protein
MILLHERQFIAGFSHCPRYLPAADQYRYFTPQNGPRHSLLLRKHTVRSGSSKLHNSTKWKIVIFWDLTPCNMSEVGGTYYINLQSPKASRGSKQQADYLLCRALLFIATAMRSSDLSNTLYLFISAVLCFMPVAFCYHSFRMDYMYQRPTMFKTWPLGHLEM